MKKRVANIPAIRLVQGKSLSEFSHESLSLQVLFIGNVVEYISDIVVNKGVVINKQMDSCGLSC